MKILHVITSLYTGGAERLMVDLLPLLCDKGKIQVELLLINGVDTPFKKRIEECGIRVTALSNTNDVYNVRNILRIRRFLKNNDYDIIHTHNTACQFYVPLSRLFLKKKHGVLVTTEHSLSNRRRNKWWLRPIDKWMYSKYESIICIADESKRSLENYIGSYGKIRLICNGVNTRHFYRPIKDISNQNHFTITMVAAIREEKDHETLFRAIAKLPNNYSLQLVGGGEKDRVNALKNLCHEMELDNRVTFMGVRMDVPDILEQSDIAVLSSHWEGFGLVAVEAMMAGKPFVATDVGGLHDVVGGAGLLFPHGDDKALATNIQWLCEHPNEYHQIALKCQNRACNYDISIMARKYLELYKTIV